MAYNISAHGDALAALNSTTWNRSVYLWMGDYWEILVDLSTQQEEVSDLMLHAKLFDDAPPRLEAQSVHVP